MILFSNMFKGQDKSVSYENLYKLFNSYAENDQRALVFVNMYIEKAKREEDLKKLIVGFEEAIYYSPLAEQKLIYADSAIGTAFRLKDNDQLMRAYLGKGIVYYYNTRSYKKALEEYLKAFKYVKNSSDGYLKNKVVYHLAIVKSYLGEHSEAAGYFVMTADYFQKNMTRKGIHPNTRLNHESGYYNSIYRLSRCYYNLQLYEKEDSLLAIGLRNMKAVDKHPVEYAYFQKGRGIQYIRNKKYDAALGHLIIAESILNDKEDFASLATVNFYLGVLNWNRGRKDQSFIYLDKVDSLVNRFKFITPEIRPSYKYLIRYSKDKGNSGKVEYYTQQLLMADSILITDFPKMSSMIKYEYDVKNYQNEKQGLLEDKKIAQIIVSILSVSGVIIITIIFYTSKAKEKKLQLRYRQLLIKMQHDREKLYAEPMSSEGADGLEINDAIGEELPVVRDGGFNYSLKDLPAQSPDEVLTDGNGQGDISAASYNFLDDTPEEDDPQNLSKDKYDPQMISNIIEKLRIFEEEKKYLQKNLKMPDVADIVGTNRSTLSHIINVYLKIHYPDYIKTLRIRYITELMLEDSKYLRYKIQSLAEICGMSSRQIFTLHFRQINGMSPTDFMNQRLKDVKDK